MAGHSNYVPQSAAAKWLESRLPVISLVRGSFVDFPTPKNLNYWWTFGGILFFVLIAQILTGIVLVMHYTPSTDAAFDSVEHIMRDVNFGWLLRYLHSNGASMFFIAVYIHIFRGLYYGSYKAPREISWILGVIIFLIMMGTAFMGYVLPWGQMSFWGATVITNLFSALPLVGESIVTWLWGGFAVDNPTLNRFFSLHYLLPFMIFGVVILHVWAFHTTGNNNPTGGEVRRGHRPGQGGEADEIDEADGVAIDEPLDVTRHGAAGPFDGLEDLAAKDRVEVLGQAVEQADRLSGLVGQLELAGPRQERGRLDVVQEQGHGRLGDPVRGGTDHPDEAERLGLAEHRRQAVEHGERLDLSVGEADLTGRRVPGRLEAERGHQRVEPCCGEPRPLDRLETGQQIGRDEHAITDQGAESEPGVRVDHLVDRDALLAQPPQQVEPAGAGVDGRVIEAGGAEVVLCGPFAHTAHPRHTTERSAAI